MKYIIKAHGLNEDFSMEFSSYNAADAKQRLERFVDLTQTTSQISSISINDQFPAFRIDPNNLTGINLASHHATDTIKF